MCRTAENLFTGTSASSLVGNGICEAQNEGVLLRLSMKEILEYHSTLEEGTLKIVFVNPRESYDRIVVLDPWEAEGTVCRFLDVRRRTSLWRWQQTRHSCWKGAW